MSCFKTRMTAFALSATAVTQTGHCPGKSEFVVDRFQLSSCPVESFSLPRSVRDIRFEIRRGDSHPLSPNNSLCPKFKAFSLKTISSQPRNIALLHLRLTRGPACTLDVAYSLNLSRDDPAGEATLARTAAELIMQGSQTDITAAPVRRERFKTIEEVQAWCSQTSASTQRLCNQLLVSR